MHIFMLAPVIFLGVGTLRMLVVCYTSRVCNIPINSLPYLVPASAEPSRQFSWAMVLEMDIPSVDLPLASRKASTIRSTFA